MSWPTTPTRFILTEVDERGLRDGDDGELLSVSEHRGVVPRRESASQQAASEDVSHYKRCEPGQLVLNKLWAFRGGLGVSPFTGLVSPAYAVYDINPSMDPGFVHYQTRSAWFVAEMTKRLRGIGSPDASVGRAPHLNTSELGRIGMYTPPLDTQRRIAAMLDAEAARIDTLIEKKRVAVGSAQVRLERLRWDLVTGRTSSAERREVALAWADTLPESWPLVSLQYLITSKYGFPFRSDGFTSDPASTPVVRIRDVVPNRVQTWTAEPPAGNVWLENGDIVIGMDGDFNHVRWQGGRAALNQRVCSVRSSSENLTDDYLTEVLGYPLRHINETVHFTTVKHLSFADLMAEKIPVPPVAEQATIVRELSSERDATERLASAANRSIELLRLRRQALITAAVTGQIDV